MLGKNGHRTVAQTVHQVLSEYAPLDKIALSKVPEHADPYRDIVWLTRAGALYGDAARSRHAAHARSYRIRRRNRPPPVLQAPLDH